MKLATTWVRLVVVPVSFALGAALVLAVITAYWLSRQIASPPQDSNSLHPRAGPPDLNTASYHLREFVAADGTPALVCTPREVASHFISPQATKLRQQLAAMGLELPPPGTIRGSLLLLHGRMGRKEDYLPMAERFCAAGLVCLIPDLPGHGSSPHRYGSYGLKEAPILSRLVAEATHSQVLPPDQPLFLFGISMGGSIATYLATEDPPPFEAIALVATFDVLDNVIRSRACMVLGTWPARLIVPVSYALTEWQAGFHPCDVRPIDRVAGLRAPTLIVHGDQDELAPLAGAKALARAIPSTLKSRLSIIEGGDHTGIFTTSHPLYAEICAWYLSGGNALHSSR